MNDEFLFIVTVAVSEHNSLQIHQRHVWATDTAQESVKTVIAELMSKIPNPNASNVQTLFTIIPEAQQKTLAG
jgi:hypothetical protein